MYPKPPELPSVIYLVGATKEQVNEYYQWLDDHRKYLDEVREVNVALGYSYKQLCVYSLLDISVLETMLPDMDTKLIQSFKDYNELRNKERDSVKLRTEYREAISVMEMQEFLLHKRKTPDGETR